MRSAKESEGFPYTLKTICYFRVDDGGKVEQISHDFTSISAAYRDAVDKKAKIFAVWPGNYRSDLFEIDDLNALADAFGVPRPDDHQHQIVWSLRSGDDEKSTYAWVDIVFECGCALNENNIKKFANDMKEQKGWDVATSKSFGYHSDGTKTEYTIRVRRQSL